MRPLSQIIRGETVVHSLIDKESLQMRPLSQIIRRETVVHSLIDKKSLQMITNYTRGNCHTLFN